MSESPRSNNSKVNATDVDVNSTKTSGVALDLKANSLTTGKALSVTTTATTGQGVDVVANSVTTGQALKVSATAVTTGSAVEITGLLTKTALNVAAGNVVVAADTLIARGYNATNKTPSIITKWDAHTDATAGSVTITIAQVLTGILEADPAADIAWTLPTAALAVAGVANVAVGDCIDFSVINTGTAAADEIITVTMGANGTAVGYMGVKCAGVAIGDSEGSGLFRLRFTNVTGAAEAYTVYRLA
jgi:hypothetical protein